MINTSNLVQAKILGTDGELRQFKNDGSPLADVAKMVLAYNAFVGSEGRSKHWKGPAADMLDMMMVKAGLWLTSKPPRQTNTNPLRWEALKELAEQIGRELSTLSVRLLSGPSDFRLISGKRHSYWLERVDPKHRPGNQLAPYWERWVILNGKMPFFTYVDQLLQAQNRVLSNVAYLDEKERRKFRIVPRGGRILDCKEKEFDTYNMSTHFSKKGWAIFVCGRATMKVYAGTHTLGQFHHSSFLSGEPVLAAGELVVDEGKLHMITCKSGHYQPTAEDMQSFLRRFKTRRGAFVLPEYPEPGEPYRVYECHDFRDNGRAAKPLAAAVVLKEMPDWTLHPETAWMESIGS